MYLNDAVVACCASIARGSGFPLQCRHINRLHIHLHAILTAGGKRHKTENMPVGITMEFSRTQKQLLVKEKLDRTCCAVVSTRNLIGRHTPLTSQHTVYAKYAHNCY